jgi:hypothetical protein
MAVYSVLEKSVSDDQLGQAEKEKLLLEEVRLFQQLKSKIVDSKSPYMATGQQKPIPAEESSGFDAVIKAIEELKTMMASELSAIRGELEQLRKK